MRKPEPLRVVLSLRLRQQDAAERLLAEALAQQQQAQQHLAALQGDLLHNRSAPHASAGALLNLVELQHRALRLPHLQQLCSAAERLLTERKALVAERQRFYLEARRAREVVEALLKQRTLAEQHKQSRHETKVSDDLFLGRMIRHTSADGSAM